MRDRPDGGDGLGGPFLTRNVRFTPLPAEDVDENE
jgi:hypothetical protein